MQIYSAGTFSGGLHEVVARPQMGGVGIVYLYHDREVNLLGMVAETDEVVVNGRSCAHTYWQVVPEEGGLVFLPHVPGGETW